MATLNRAGTILRLIRDSLFAPLTSIYEFGMGGWHYFKTLFQGVRDSKKFPYYADSLFSVNPGKEVTAKRFPFTIGLSRMGGFILTGLAILGFIGALAVPLPGIAPLYALSVGAVLKACGITLGVTLFGRTAGALLGSVIDFFGYRKKLYANNNKATKPNLGHVIKTTLTIGIFGSNPRTLTGFVQLMNERKIEILPLIDNNKKIHNDASSKEDLNLKDRNNSTSSRYSDSSDNGAKSAHSLVSQQLQSELQLGSREDNCPLSEASTPNDSDLSLDHTVNNMTDDETLKSYPANEEKYGAARLHNSLEEYNNSSRSSFFFMPLNQAVDQQNVSPSLQNSPMGTPKYITSDSWEDLLINAPKKEEMTRKPW